MESASVLVVGARGMAGTDFVQCWPGAAGLDLPELDITDAQLCRRVLEELEPLVVVNCAAATGVDWCETHRDEAMRINADILSQPTQVIRLGARFVRRYKTHALAAEAIELMCRAYERTGATGPALCKTP